MADAMKRIVFTKTVQYEVNGPGHPDNPVYSEGEIVDLREDLAARWVKRGVAVYASAAVSAGPVEVAADVPTGEAPAPGAAPDAPPSAPPAPGAAAKKKA